MEDNGIGLSQNVICSKCCMFNLKKTIHMVCCVYLYLIEHASVIIDWIIACNCPNYTI